MKRGTVVWVNLSDARPPEMNKVRPAVVLSNSILNGRLDTLVVVPLSTQAGEIWPLRIKVSTAARKQSFAIIPGLRQVSKARLFNASGMLNSADLSKVEQAATDYLAG